MHTWDMPRYRRILGGIGVGYICETCPRTVETEDIWREWRGRHLSEKPTRIRGERYSAWLVWGASIRDAHEHSCKMKFGGGGGMHVGCNGRPRSFWMIRLPCLSGEACVRDTHMYSRIFSGLHGIHMREIPTCMLASGFSGCASWGTPMRDYLAVRWRMTFGRFYEVHV